MPLFIGLAISFVTGGLCAWYFVGSHFATLAFEYREAMMAAHRRTHNAQQSLDQAREAWAMWEARAIAADWEKRRVRRVALPAAKPVKPGAAHASLEL